MVKTLIKLVLEKDDSHPDKQQLLDLLLTNGVDEKSLNKAQSDFLSIISGLY